MSAHFENELEMLKREMQAIGALVEENLGLAVHPFEENYDKQTFRKLVEQDRRIDEMEVALEENCLKLLALYQPVAGDLRFIASVLKINNDLERISDLAVKVCKNAGKIRAFSLPGLNGRFQAMSDALRAQMRLALRAFLDRDSRLAQKVLQGDDEIDGMHAAIKEIIIGHLKDHAEEIEDGLRALQISRRLERIADLITNIAEDVIYMVEAFIVRHGAEKG